MAMSSYGDLHESFYLNSYVVPFLLAWPALRTLPAICVELKAAVYVVERGVEANSRNTDYYLIVSNALLKAQSICQKKLGFTCSAYNRFLVTQ